MKDIKDNSIDLILCDLPYQVTDCKWDKALPLEPLWNEYRRITKENGAIVLFSIQPFTTALINSNKKEYRYNWYWKKNNVTGGQFAKVQPMRCIEDICVFYRKKPTYNPQGLIKLDKPIISKIKSHYTELYQFKTKDNEHKQYYTNYPKNLLEFDNVPTGHKYRYHNTQKPVPLLEYLIKTYTNEGEIVLDNCMGSGSTGVAAINTNRKFIGIEITDKYYEIAKQRINKEID